MIEAALAALLVWAVAVPLAGVGLQVTYAGTVQTTGPMQILLVALLAGIVAWAVLAGIEKSSRTPRRIWFPAAATVGVASLAGPLFGAASAPAMLILLGLHLVVGGILTVGLPAVAGPRKPRQQDELWH